MSAYAANEYSIIVSNSAITVNEGVISNNTRDEVYLTKVTETHSDVPEDLRGLENTIINIAAAGTYRITGVIDNGQIVVNAADKDLVTLALDNATINCQTAPAILIKNVSDPQTAGTAGVTIMLADNSTNHISGASGEDNSGAIS